jgi:hypothetical protein
MGDFEGDVALLMACSAAKESYTCEL